MQEAETVAVDLSQTNEPATAILSPMRAIRAKCLDCCCGSAQEVRLCPVKKCSLYPYRFGRRQTKRELTEEQKEALRARFAKAREARREKDVVRNESD